VAGDLRFKPGYLRAFVSGGSGRKNTPEKALAIEISIGHMQSARAIVLGAELRNAKHLCAKYTCNKSR
jgi:hypothetical protein